MVDVVLIEAITLLVSLAILSKSSSLVVDNATKLSKFFGISQVAIGFILLSVATSLPELSVSVLSSNAGEGAIAAGNVFGSNIADILLVLGVGAFLYGIRIGKNELKDIAIILVLTTIISAYIIFNSSITNQALGFLEGVILILLFVLYIAYILRKKTVDGDGYKLITKKEAMYSFLIFSAAILLVLVSSSFVVDSAVKIAKLLNIAESFIGATIIAIGTSLPELSVDLQAIRKKQYGMALGDAIGSTMTNITLVLGTAAIINPITIILPIFIAALLFAIIANIVLLYVAAVNKKLQKLGGALFLLLYLVFIVVIFYLQIGELNI
ncbi:putative membrane protein [Candidatus Bilamarchaeum dharawalense]|uniref:Putative membrane protein n=1 Tax=Candidatus Bilamarchaeum dharawalense TaxID=2885759 RepID=A0A5E4LP91_9ARCH|nr:putative membrane protein [Candidatus Bilamarchaeum dharawalense]